MLLAIIKLLRSCIQRFLIRFTTPSQPRHGYPPLRSTGRNDHRHSPKKPEWLKGEIIRLKAIMPQAGCRAIADICNRRFAASCKVTVGKTFVHQILQRHDYEIQILRRNFKHVTPKPVACNLIWGIDLTGKTDMRGNLHFLFGILDPGACPEHSRRSSRALLHLQALHNKTSRTLIACISKIIRTYGKPKIIRTDCGRVNAKRWGTHRRTLYGCNEAIFTSRIFRIGMKQLGIRHQRTAPGCPWQNDRIKRLFGTLKDKHDQRIYFPLPLGEGLRVREQLNRDFDTFRYWYAPKEVLLGDNHVRPHQNLNVQTPAEAWNSITPYAKSSKQEHWFEAWNGLLAGYCLRY